MKHKKELKEGSKWLGHDGTAFRVLHTVHVEGHTWVHYIKEGEPKEFSCYIESFLERFRETPE